MAVEYETIRPEVERLGEFITTDLDLLVNKNMGGNYLAAAMITCACDAIAHLKYGESNRGWLFFKDLLPDNWKPVASGLYNAIRNGIVHVYDTKTIVIDSRRLSIVISWREKSHMYLSPSGTDVYVNVLQLARDLKSAITQFETELKSNESLRGTFYNAMTKDREFHVSRNDQKSWDNALANAPKISTQPATQADAPNSGEHQ